MSQWFQHLVSRGGHGEVSDATIQGYMRSASQLEEVWQQIDDKVDALILQGMAPWDAYARMGYALAFVRGCRMITVFVQEMLKANAEANPTNAGYLPEVSYKQALALCEHIEPFIEEAVKASINPHYVLSAPSFPFVLGPHIQYTGPHYPLSHLQGLLGAAQQMREWTAGLLAKYDLAIHAAKTPVPQPITAHLEKMNAELELGDFHLRTGVDMAGQISQKQITDELSEKAEGFLWEAMEGFFKTSQLIAFPMFATRQQQNVPGTGKLAQHPSSTLHPVVPDLPTPDTTALFNQVITSSGAVQEIPATPSPEVFNLLNQVTASSETTQATSAPASTTSDVSMLLNQIANNPATSSGELSQLEKSGEQAGKVPTSKQTRAEGDTLDLLAEICGEQKPNE